MTYPKDDRFYFGHHKCASNWMSAMIQQFCRGHGWGFEVIDRPNLPRFDARDNKPTFHIRRGAHFHHTDILEPGHKAFQLIRDPRDALVSGYWSWRKSHENNTEKILKTREQLNTLPVEDGLIIMLDNLIMLEGLRDWPIGQIPAILDVRYEDMLADTPGVFATIFNHLEVELSSADIDRLVTNTSFESLTGRKPGQEDTSNHFRKGIAGDWKNAFTPKVARAFKDRFQPDLVRLGYETDDTWVDLVAADHAASH